MAKRDRAHANGAMHSGMLSTRMRQGFWGRLGITLACVSLATSLSAPLANAQVIKDPRAPIIFQPKVSRSANGTPLVNITKPSFGGISHNKFQRYDIDTRGVILNNSKLGGTSIIGGKVTANPNLVGTRPARVILNEVTSAAASTLNGPTEVFGSKADVIIANPNGVGCVGCTFINSSRVTLSTGTPLPDYRRGTVSFDVERGKVSIAGQGLSSGDKTPLDTVTLIGRQIEVSGPVKAKEAVRLRAGGMTYNPAGDTAVAKSAAQLPVITGPAIHSGTAGTIAAGTVSVISRDVDLGVQLNGKVEALSGELSIRSSGNLSLAASYAKNDVTLTADGQVNLTGNNQALGRISVAGKRIEVGLNGELTANDAIVLEALQSLATRGVLQAGNTIILVSGGELVAEGAIAANGEVMLEGRSLRTVDLKIGGGAVSVTGLDEVQIDNTIIVAGVDSVKVAGQKVGLGVGTAFDAVNRIVVDAKGDLTNGTVLDYGNLDLSVRNTYTNAAGGQLALDHIVMSASNSIVNAGILYGRISTLIDAGSLSNTETGVIYGKDLTLKISGDLTNLGQIVSDQTLSIVAGGAVANNNVIQAGGALTVKAAGYRANSAAAVLAGLTADLIVSGALENSGQILGEQRVTAQAAALSNRATGAINAGTNTLTIEGDLLNEGIIGGVASLSITTQGHLSSAGSLLAGEGNLTLTAKAGKVTSGADLIAKGTVTIDAAAFDGTSTTGRVSGSNVTIDVSGAFTSRGLVNAENALAVKAGSITVGASAPQTDAGTLVGKTIELTSGGSLVNDGTISATGDAAMPDLRLTATSVQNNGAIVADDDLTVNARDYTSTQQGQIGGKVLTVRLGNGSFRNFGLVSGSTLVDIQAGQLENGATIADTHAGLILGGTIKLGDAAGTIASVNNLGSIEAATDITIQAGNVTNAGSMLAERNSTITADRVTNDGSINSGESLVIDSTFYTATNAEALLSSKVTKLGTDTRSIQIDNAGRILGSTTLIVKAGSLTNRGTFSVIGGTSADVTARGVLNNEGSIIGDSALTVTAFGALTNSGTIAGAEGSLILKANGGATNSGKILAKTTLTMTATQFSNASANATFGADRVTATISGAFHNYGLVSGTTQLTLSARDILNGPSSGETGGVISGGTMALTIGSNLTNQGVLQVTNAGLQLHVPGTLSNTGKISANGDVDLTLPNGFVNAGEVVAASTLRYNSGSVYNGLAGSSLNAGNIELRYLKGGFYNAGKITALGQVDISSSDVVNSAGGSIDGNDIRLQTGVYIGAGSSAFRNDGTVTSQNSLTLVSGGRSFSNSGRLESLNSLELTTNTDLVNAGLIKAAGLMTMSSTVVTSLLNVSSGRIDANIVDINLYNIVNSGKIVGGALTKITTNSLVNRGESLANYASISGGDVVIQADEALYNDLNSEIHADNSATINTWRLSGAFFANTTRDKGLFKFGKDLSIKLNSTDTFRFTQDLRVKGNLSFENTGAIVNTFVVAAEGDLSLKGDEITNGNSSGTDQGTISAGGSLSLTAAGDIRNNASTILAGKDITLRAGLSLINTDIVKADDTVKRALIQSVEGSITGRAKTIENRGSTMSAAGGDLFLRASTINNLTENGQQAYMYAAQTADISKVALDTGTIQGSTVKIGGKTVQIGNPNIGDGPPKIPPATINLASAFSLKGAGFTRGQGNIYDPTSEAKDENIATKGGLNIGAEVDADGKPVTTSGPRVIGKVSFLYAVPFDTSEDRNPSWIFASVGADASDLTFFADPVAERMLIQDALVKQTGRGLLDPKYKNPKQQQEEFYQGTVDFLKANSGVKLGDKLTTAQRKKVTKPILWYSWQTVDGKRVLVPELILPEKDLEKYAYTPGQGLVLGENIEIKANKVTNTGAILATESLVIDAKEFLNERKVIDGKLQTGGLVSAKDLYIETKKDITNRGGTLLAGNSLTLKAGGSIHIETQKIVTTTTSGGGKSWNTSTTVQNIGGLVSSGGTLSMSARNKLEIIGSTVTSKGDMSLIGKKGVTVAAAVDTVDSASGGKKSGFLKSSSFASNLSTETNLGSVVSSSRGSVSIRTERGDIKVAGSHVSAREDVNLLAGYNAEGNLVKGSKASVKIESVQDTVDSSFMQKKSGFGLFFGNGGFDIYRKTSMAGTTSVGTNVASSISSKNGNVNIKAARDVNIEGSAVTAKRQIFIDAKRDVIIDPGKHEAEQTFTKKVTGVGVHFSGGDGGFGVQAGFHASSAGNGQAASRAARSILSGGEGISIHAGRDSIITAATITSHRQVKIDAGRDNKILAGMDTNHSYQTNKEVFAGIQLKVSQNVSGAMQQIAQSPALAASGYGNPAYKAVAAMSGALSLTQGVLSLSNPTVSASLTAGASGSKSHTEAWSNTAVGTTIKAGSLVLSAGRDIHLEGVQAKVKNDIKIDAGRNVTIESAQSYAGSSSSQSSWNVGVGVGGSCGAASGCSGGIYVEGGASKANADSWSVTQLNSDLTAGGNVHIGSGKNTTIAGAVIRAETIDLAVKGNLTVESRQNTAHGSGSSASVGGSVIIGVGSSPISGSVNVGGGSSTSDLAWVKEQTGLHANTTLTATVGKHTQINGAVLNSTSGQLTLDTGTLGFGDIQDHDTATSTNGQVGVGLGLQQNGTGQTGQLSGTVSGSYASHDIEQTTKATIGEGTIVIRDKDKQKQDVKELNRDPDTAQVTIKDEREGVQFYVSSDAIKEISSGFAGIKNNFEKLPEGLARLPQRILDGVSQAAKALDLTGKTPEQGAKALAEALVKNGTLKPGQKPTADAVIDAWDDPEVRAAVIACAGSGQQGFNLHNLVFTPAYAAGCGSIVIGGKSFDITKEGAQAIVCVTAASAGSIVGKTLGFAVRAVSSRGMSVVKDILSADPTGGVVRTNFTTAEGVEVSFDNHGAELYATLDIDDGSLKTSFVLRKSGDVLVLDSVGIAGEDGQWRALSPEEFAVVASSQAEALAGIGVILPNKANDTGKQIPKPGISGKEGAKDVPSWAKGERPNISESGKEFAERLLDQKYGKGNWEPRKTPEYSQIKKWGDRAFIDPTKR